MSIEKIRSLSTQLHTTHDELSAARQTIEQLSLQLVEKDKQLLMKDSAAIQEFKDFMKMITEQRAK